jgi:hypothetical protein
MITKLGPKRETSGEPSSLYFRTYWMSTLEPLGFALAGLFVLNVLLRLGRTCVRSAKVMPWVWKRSLPAPLSSTGSRTSQKLLDLLAMGLAKFAERPLRVEPFEGGKDLDAAGVSSALSAAMTRIGSLRRSGVDSVTAPVAASSALDAIAGGVKAAPAGGELAAALLRLGWWLLARGELQLSGRVLESEAAGPGLALTIATASGRTIERLTVWASEFEPMLGESSDKHAETDRLMCIATAGAVWTHFTILFDIWHLGEKDLRELLQTAVWRSYAFMQVGLEGKDHRGPDLTRALYARAVDADPYNSVAQFNLASLELDDAWFEDVRGAGLLRLQRVHDELDGDKLLDWAPRESPADRFERERALLDRDPLHYQVAYKRGACKLNEDVLADSELEVDQDGSTAHKRLVPADAGDLATHLCDLEETLQVLHVCDSRRWPVAGSKAWRELRQMLSAVEGTMLVLWAMVAARVGRADGTMWSADELNEPGRLSGSDGLSEPHVSSESDRAGDHPDGGACEQRSIVIERLRKGTLVPGAAIHFARGNHVWRTSRTRLNLACWYADREMLSEALRELELGLECGGEMARRRMRDPQLRQVRAVCAEDWEKLLLRYVPGRREAREATENGRGPLDPAFLPKPRAAVSGSRSSRG